MSSAGLWMLVALGALVLATGLPVWALLVGVASAAAALGLATGAFDAAVLSSLPPRILSLLENDLLQALPLYVFIGVLLQRLPLADALYATLRHALRRTGAGRSLGALGIGTLVAPMNGSVASSSALLARLVAPRLAHAPPAQALALVAAAATIGVVVPPSLVLILLGDAMMRAHTEAANLPGTALVVERIVNTQDVLQAALLPALAVLALWVALAWWQERRLPREADAPPERTAVLQSLATIAVIVGLLAGVFTGRLFAVEAAAAGGCLLAAVTLVRRWLDRRQWLAVLDDTLALAGALFALLVGATTFSLVFRLFGTDRWLSDLILASPLPAPATAAAMLALVAACAWVLDAFEMIFVVIPLVAPPLIAQLGDAQQVAVLLLLVLQASFLLPPMGYAVLMARAQSGLPRVGARALLAALAPLVMAQLLVVGIVFAVPRAVHLLDAPAPVAAPAAPSEDDIVRRMREMAPAEADVEAPAR